MMKYRTFKENPDGTITADDSTAKLSAEEFRRLQALMPEVRWLGMMHVRPEQILNPSYVPTAEHAEFLKNYAADPDRFLKTMNPQDNEEI
jgi:hypothetical protein